MKVLDLFSGIGGFSLGLESTGEFSTIAFCEMDLYCQRILTKHWPYVPIYNDVRTMPSLPCDVLTAGFPCQDVSVGGRGGSIDHPRTGLWHEAFRRIRDIRPKYVLLENVYGLLTRGLSRVLFDLASIGYDPWFVEDRKMPAGLAPDFLVINIVVVPEGPEGWAESDSLFKLLGKAGASGRRTVGPCDGLVESAASILPERGPGM